MVGVGNIQNCALTINFHNIHHRGYDNYSIRISSHVHVDYLLHKPVILLVSRYPDTGTSSAPSATAALFILVTKPALDLFSILDL